MRVTRSIDKAHCYSLIASSKYTAKHIDMLDMALMPVAIMHGLELTIILLETASAARQVDLFIQDKILDQLILRRRSQQQSGTTGNFITSNNLMYEFWRAPMRAEEARTQTE